MAAHQKIQPEGVRRHTLDEKNRVIVPQALRGKGAQEVVILQHPRGYLAVFTPEQFERLHDSLVEEYPDQKKQRDFIFVMNHLARSAAIDAQGRMSLSQDEITHAGIDREAAMVRSHRAQFEVWSPSRDEVALREKLTDFGATLEQLGA